MEEQLLSVFKVNMRILRPPLLPAEWNPDWMADAQAATVRREADAWSLRRAQQRDGRLCPGHHERPTPH